MTKSLRKKVVKQQSRLAALNLLGTPSGSRAGSEVEDDSDTSLVISTHSIHQTDPVSIQDDLRHCIDELGEKSVAARQVALTTLSKLLGHYYCGFFFNQASSQEAILQLLLRIIRRPASSREAILATKAIGLAFVNQSPDISQGEQEAFYSMTLPFLKSIIKDGNNPELKRQSINSLALITFIAASHIDTLGGLDYLYKILISGGSSVQSPSDDDQLSLNDIQTILESSLRAYGLMYASLYGENRGNRDDAWDEWQATMPAHLDLLESNSKDVRVAAGENIALMYECAHAPKKATSSDDDGNDNVNCNSEDDREQMEELLDILNRLANESSRRVNKQNRKEQKSAFRDIVKSIQSGVCPKEKLKLGRQRFVFKGWAQLLKLHAFRSFLGPGLLNHFEGNELIQGLFANSIEFSDDEEPYCSDDTHDSDY